MVAHSNTVVAVGFIGNEVVVGVVSGVSVVRNGCLVMQISNLVRQRWWRSVGADVANVESHVLFVGSYGQRGNCRSMLSIIFCFVKGGFSLFFKVLNS